MSWFKTRLKQREKMRKIQEKAEKKAEKKIKHKLFRNKKGFSDNSLGVKTIESCVDFTLLDPRTTDKDVVELMKIAAKNQYYSVVVPPVFVSFAKNYIENHLSGSLLVGSVVGFPLGNISTKGKICEVKNLIKAGADEIEVSLDISMVKMGEFGGLRAEISRIVRAAKRRVVKVVLETAYLTEAEIEKVVKICDKSKVDYVMTSSGYAPLGATLENVEKLVTLASGRMGVKASGGIKTRIDAESFLRIGASRIGTSRII